MTDDPWKNTNLFLLLDNCPESSWEECVKDKEQDSDPPKNNNECTVKIRRVRIRIPEVGKVSQNPKEEFDEADEDGSLGLCGEVGDDVLPLGLRLGHVEEDDEGEDDADGRHQEDVVKENRLCGVVPGDEASGIGAQLIVEEEQEGAQQGQGSTIPEGNVDGVAAANDAEGEGPEGCMCLAGHPRAGGDVEVDHDEAYGHVDVGAVTDGVEVGKDVSDEGCDPCQWSVHPQVVEHVINLVQIKNDLSKSFYVHSFINREIVKSVLTR